jgi:DNA-binding NarL/FixJ family response regulator
MDVQTIRVILADDHQMVREGLVQCLNNGSGIEVVGHAGGGREVLELCTRVEADVLVLDYALQDIDGAAVTAALRRDECPIRVVIVTVHDNVHYALKSLDAGAHGFVVKSDGLDELVRAIRTVAEGGTYVTPHLDEQVRQHRRGPKGRHIGLDKLSQREFELLRLMGQGMNLQRCAQKMAISESTASTYRSRLMTKLDLADTAQIIRFAIENGIAN